MSGLPPDQPPPLPTNLSSRSRWRSSDSNHRLPSGAIARLAEGGTLQLDLFDDKNLISLTCPDYPGERLVACRNPALAKRRTEKRKLRANSKHRGPFNPIEAH